MCRFTGNLFFHICCEIRCRIRNRATIGFTKNYKAAWQELSTTLFLLDNFNYKIYWQAIKILFGKV